MPQYAQPSGWAYFFIHTGENMKPQLTYEGLHSYMEGFAEQIDESNFIFNCADGTPYRGWIEFQTSEQAKDFVKHLGQSYDLTGIGAAATIIGFHLVDESTDYG